MPAGHLMCEQHDLIMLISWGGDWGQPALGVQPGVPAVAATCATPGPRSQSYTAHHGFAGQPTQADHLYHM
eukprot:CAMPEP_0202900220 /NCGR_PEP_ID=MMETSP1392-20130828/10452_1 /ASSEMBLY_ACC=CAM_ASM_000868 /TAXON_ID=225041 /ORGANISM="Chlamydomonas chlamydogama, Strain SAG 11-48b" /LENGTH=70 /DNA_ID=CAMNT_0049586567 /DNA_START=163 /DNA_END=375 /DNA_ORIENTATION=+